MIGYDVEVLKGTKFDAEKSPVIRPKKQKTSETNGDEDWNYLLDSKHHSFCFDQVQNLLGFGSGQANKSDNDMQDDMESYSGKNLNFHNHRLKTSSCMVLMPDCNVH